MILFVCYCNSFSNRYVSLCVCEYVCKYKHLAVCTHIYPHILTQCINVYINTHILHTLLTPAIILMETIIGQKTEVYLHI